MPIFYTLFSFYFVISFVFYFRFFQRRVANKGVMNVLHAASTSMSMKELEEKISNLLLKSTSFEEFSSSADQILFAYISKRPVLLLSLFSPGTLKFDLRQIRFFYAYLTTWRHNSECRNRRINEIADLAKAHFKNGDHPLPPLVRVYQSLLWPSLACRTVTNDVLEAQTRRLISEVRSLAVAGPNHDHLPRTG